MVVAELWLRLEGELADYGERPKCHRCGRKLKRREKVSFTIAVCPRATGGSLLFLPGGGMDVSVFCMKCKSV